MFAGALDHLLDASLAIRKFLSHRRSPIGGEAAAFLCDAGAFFDFCERRRSLLSRGGLLLRAPVDLLDSRRYLTRRAGEFLNGRRQFFSCARDLLRRLLTTRAATQTFR